MRILQTSDNHIGEIQYARLDPATGLNARSLDYLDSFKQIASKAKELDVDVLLVAGDFFTKVNPHTRYVYETIRIISDIANSGLRLIFVGGNHEAPRLATTLNPLKLLEHLDKVNVVLEPRTITIENLDFVCVPAPSNFDQIRILFNPMLEEALKNSNSHKKILAAHAPLVQAVASSESAMEFFMGEGVDARQIPDKFIHCAFGHIHKFQKIDLGRGAVYYSGSSERFDWSEEGEAKYAILIDVTEQGTNVEPIKLQSRSMRTIVDDDCSGLSAPNIMDNMISRIEAPSGNSAGSARSLVLAAIIVQLVFLFLPIFFFLLFIPTSVSVSTATTTFTFGNATIGAISSPVQNQIVGFGGFALAGFILIFIIGFSVIWILLDYFLIYRNLRQPASYQSASTSAIVLGILQLIFGGIVPGILLIIAYIKINDALRYSTT
jgi:Icc-related predicted phosphoesterase